MNSVREKKGEDPGGYCTHETSGEREPDKKQDDDDDDTIPIHDLEA